jgi:hypothetical protein
VATYGVRAFALRARESQRFVGDAMNGRTVEHHALHTYGLTPLLRLQRRVKEPRFILTES